MSSPIDDQPAGLDLRLGDALAGQELLQRIAAVGRIAEPERLLRRRRSGRGRADRRAPWHRPADCSCVLEERRRHLHHVGQAGALAVRASRRPGRAPASARRPFRRCARPPRESSCRQARSGTGNGRPRRRSRSNGSGPSCPRSGRTASSRRGTDSTPTSRRAAHWSCGGPTTTRWPTTEEIGTRSRISSRKAGGKRIAILSSQSFGQKRATAAGVPAIHRGGSCGVGLAN